MHPDLEKIANELKNSKENLQLRLAFSLECLKDVACNLEDEDAINAFQEFRDYVENFGDHTNTKLEQLASRLDGIANKHPGSKSIDGTRHAAVSATYALSKAAHGNAVEAAAYAAYSLIYGYGGYAVNDPELFTEVHQKQLEKLLSLTRATRFVVQP